MVIHIPPFSNYPNPIDQNPLTPTEKDSEKEEDIYDIDLEIKQKAEEQQEKFGLTKATCQTCNVTCTCTTCMSCPTQCRTCE